MPFARLSFACHALRSAPCRSLAAVLLLVLLLLLAVAVQSGPGQFVQLLHHSACVCVSVCTAGWSRGWSVEVKAAAPEELL